jgi:hypothetical protein
VAQQFSQDVAAVDLLMAELQYLPKREPSKGEKKAKE